MSQPARVYRILIVAPPDVDDARQIVDRLILDWNNRNFRDRRVVLLPLAWDNQNASAAPSILKREVAGGCDLMVGVFWTRLSSVPGSDQSELLNEIDQLKRAGVPVLLFFSKQRASIDEIEPAEISRLREFRRHQANGCIVEDFVDPMQLNERFARHLDQQIRVLLAEESLNGGTQHPERPPVDLTITFADPSSGQSTGDRLTLESKYFEIRNFDKIPDYHRAENGNAAAASLWGATYNQINKDYYRDYIKYVFQGSILRPIRFVVQNTGLIGLREVRLDVSVAPAEGGIFCLRPEERLVRPEKETIALRDRMLGTGIGFAVETFNTSVELPGIQPQRTVVPPTVFFLGADRSVTCTLDIAIFADSLAKPLRRELTVDLQVTRESVDALEFFEVLRER